VDKVLPTHFDTGEYSEPGYQSMFLYVEQGPGAGQLIPLKQGALVLGRSSSCDLRLQHPSISRRHAQLSRQADRVILRDMGSQNGTFVNRIRLYGEVELRHGDQLSLGNAVLRLRAPGQGASGAAATEGGPDTSELPRKRRLRRLLLMVALGVTMALLAVARLLA
jgi:pSer/pThr/pTyr-binding forkhead associated (FHA) protein